MHTLNRLTTTGVLTFAFAGTLLCFNPATAQETQPAATAPAQELPKASDIVGKALEAMGGRSAVAGVKTLSYTLTAIPVMGDQQSDIMVKTAPGRKVIAEMAMPTGMAQFGLSDDVAWMVQGDTYTVVPNEQLGQFEMLNQYSMLLALASTDATFEAMELKDIAGRECCKIQTTTKDGTKHIGYFATDDGTPMAGEAAQDTPMGPMVMTIEFKQPTEVSGINLFSNASVTVPGMGAMVNLVYKELKVNDVPASVFDVPEQIKEQLDAEPATTQPSGSVGG